MRYTVVGIRRDMSFDTKEGGKIQGAKLHVLSEAENVEGHAVDSFFISASSPVFLSLASVKPDMDLEIYFNRYGKVDSIAPV